MHNLLYNKDYRRGDHTGCGNITSFFVMRGNQAVEVVAGWACFHSRDEILKFPWKYSQSQSLKKFQLQFEKKNYNYNLDCKISVSYQRNLFTISLIVTEILYSTAIDFCQF